jgi:glycosyltransferase involved in cell wall biosynthesis
MLGKDYEIFVYAPEGPEIPGATLVSCLDNKSRIMIFGKDDDNRLSFWPTDEQSRLFNEHAIAAMRPRISPRDLILSFGGSTHKLILDAFPNHLRCEPGVGYQGIITNHCAFESYAWMHWVYAKREINDGRWFDCVIPNYFDPAEFKLGDGPRDYLLFLGRLISRKGPHIASQIAEAAELELVVAGAGGTQLGNDIVASEVTIKNATYMGTVDVEERAELLSNARALLVPTTYIEPFGGVAVEAMMSGTPVISSDWGAFTETIQEGISGFRFHTISEAIAAVEKTKFLVPEKVREYAINNYSLEAIAPKFKIWFNRLNSLWDKGWYA